MDNGQFRKSASRLFIIKTNWRIEIKIIDAVDALDLLVGIIDLII